MPDWTDLNVHDPGVTLLELLAWSLLGCVVGFATAAYIRRRRRRRAHTPLI